MTVNFHTLNITDVSAKNKYDVIKYLLCNNNISRLDVANALGLSSMTVGKVVAAMLENKLLDSLGTQGQRGRSTEILYSRHSLCTLLLQIKDSGFYASFVDNSGTQNNIITHRRNADASLEDDISLFLSSVKKESVALPFFVLRITVRHPRWP